MDLNRFGRHPFCNFRRIILGHGRFFYERQTGITQARGVIHKEPGGFNFDCHAGQVELDGLKFGDGLAELLPLFCILDGVIERTLGESHQLGTDADAPFVQGFDGDFIAFAEFTEKIFFGNTALVHDQFAGG